VKFLLDTNVVSELRRRAPAAAVLRWFAHVAQDDLYLSALTVGEVRQSIESLRRRDSVAASSLDAWRAELVAAYDDRIVSITADIADLWGRLNVPDRVPAVDGLTRRRRSNTTGLSSPETSPTWSGLALGPSIRSSL